METEPHCSRRQFIPLKSYAKRYQMLFVREQGTKKEQKKKIGVSVSWK